MIPEQTCHPWVVQRRDDVNFALQVVAGCSAPRPGKQIVELGRAVPGRPTRFPQGREFPRDYTHVADVAQRAAHTFEQARGSGAWYAVELTELLPHVARGLNINWDEATRYAGLNAES